MQHATPLVVWLQTLHHAQAPTPFPIARGPTGRSSRDTHRNGTGCRRGSSDQLKPRPDTDIANEPVGLLAVSSSAPLQPEPIQQCVQGETNRKGDGAGKGWGAGRQSAGQAEALADSMGGDPQHTPEFLCVPVYGGGGTGGPAPTSSSDLEG